MTFFLWLPKPSHKQFCSFYFCLLNSSLLILTHHALRSLCYMKKLYVDVPEVNLSGLPSCINHQPLSELSWPFNTIGSSVNFSHVWYLFATVRVPKWEIIWAQSTHRILEIIINCLCHKIWGYFLCTVITRKSSISYDPNKCPSEEYMHFLLL